MKKNYLNKLHLPNYLNIKSDYYSQPNLKN